MFLCPSPLASFRPSVDPGSPPINCSFHRVVVPTYTSTPFSRCVIVFIHRFSKSKNTFIRHLMFGGGGRYCPGVLSVYCLTVISPFHILIYLNLSSDKIRPLSPLIVVNNQQPSFQKSALYHFQQPS